MKKRIITAALLLSLTAITNANELTHKGFLEQVVEAEIQVRAIPENMDLDASQSELGQLSRQILGKLYTYVESISHKDESAIVKAHIGQMTCLMDYQNFNHSSQPEKNWKLTKINCQ